MPKKVSKKGPKKGPKKGQYYSLKQKSEGYFSFFFKNAGHSDRPTSTEDLKMLQVLVPLRKIAKIWTDRHQTDRHQDMFWKRSGGRNKRCAQKVENLPIEYFSFIILVNEYNHSVLPTAIVGSNRRKY